VAKKKREKEKKEREKRKERKKGATEGNLRQGGINERRDRDALGDVVSLRVRPRALTALPRRGFNLINPRHSSLARACSAAAD
jgi:hypothetical protein